MPNEIGRKESVR